jgi:hypothetical protein
VYFNLSCVKYAFSSLYPGFITDKDLRLFGSLIAFVCLYVSIYILKIFSSNKHKLSFSFDSLFDNDRLLILFYLLSILSLCIQIQSLLKAESIYIGTRDALSSLDLFVCTLRDSYFVFFVTFGYFLRNKKYVKIILLSYFLLSFLLTINLGARSIFFTNLLVFIAVLMMYSSEIYRRINLIIFIPLIALCYTFFVFYFSGRWSGVNISFFSREFAYRFDLTDFAITLLDNDFFNFNFNFINEAFFYALPSFLFNDKTYIVKFGAYSDALFYKNLAFTDYTDSLFSLGSNFIGFWGFVLIYPTITLFLLSLENKIRMINKVSFLSLLAFIYFSVNIEKTWFSFFAGFRNSILSFMLLYFMWWIIFKLCKFKLEW